MKKIDTYSAAYAVNLAPNVAVNEQFLLNANNQAFFIRSVTFDYELQVGPVFHKIALEQNINQTFNFWIGNVAQERITKSFENWTVPGNIISDGNSFYLFNAQSIKFENWFIQNHVDVIVHSHNLDLINNWLHRWTLIVEIEKI